MASLNKVTLIGNVGKDPDIRATQDGREIANLTVATSEHWKDKATGERKEKTEWHKVSVFNENLVNVVKNYVKKGSKLYLEGSLQTRRWTDKDGVDKYSTEIVLQNYGGQIILLDAKKHEQEPTQQAPKSQPDNRPADLDDEIPF